MLIKMQRPNVYTADSMEDIDGNYTKLVGSLVLLHGGELYAVSNKDKNGHGMLIAIPGANKYFDEIKVAAEIIDFN